MIIKEGDILICKQTNKPEKVFEVFVDVYGNLACYVGRETSGNPILSQYKIEVRDEGSVPFLWDYYYSLKQMRKIKLNNIKNIK